MSLKKFVQIIIVLYILYLMFFNSNFFYDYETELFYIDETQELFMSDKLIISVDRGNVIEVVINNSRRDELVTSQSVIFDYNRPFPNTRGSTRMNTIMVSGYSGVTTFTGPPENSPYTRREFRVKFYGTQMIWLQTRKNVITGNEEQRRGTVIVPIRSINYSIDM
ncbi:MAG: hypothetical protein FWF57_02610 [Defluviitaleaceae bacterium]|nr:hypothetical protein [Defluviitaleaceae bacterium]